MNADLNANLRQTKLTFELDFRKKRLSDHKADSLLEMSLGELLYRVLMGDGELPMEKLERS